MSALVVDDDVTVRTLLVMQLEKLGILAFRIQRRRSLASHQQLAILAYLHVR